MAAQAIARRSAGSGDGSDSLLSDSDSSAMSNWSDFISSDSDEAVGVSSDSDSSMMSDWSDIVSPDEDFFTAEKDSSASGSPHRELLQ